MWVRLKIGRILQKPNRKGQLSRKIPMPLVQNKKREALWDAVHVRLLNSQLMFSRRGFDARKLPETPMLVNEKQTNQDEKIHPKTWTYWEDGCKSG